jgi:hypothetical protein
VTGNSSIGGNKELRKPRCAQVLIIEREVEDRFLPSKAEQLQTVPLVFGF